MQPTVPMDFLGTLEMQLRGLPWAQLLLSDSSQCCPAVFIACSVAVVLHVLAIYPFFIHSSPAFVVLAGVCSASSVSAMTRSKIIEPTQVFAGIPPGQLQGTMIPTPALRSSLISHHRIHGICTGCGATYRFFFRYSAVTNSPKSGTVILLSVDNLDH